MGAFVALRGLAEQRLVDMRVEMAVGLDLAQALAVERLAQLALHEAHALLDADRLERPLEIVEHGQELTDEPLVRTRDEVLLVARDALAVVVEVRCEALQVLQVLVPLSLRIGHPALERIDARFELGDRVGEVGLGWGRARSRVTSLLVHDLVLALLDDLVLGRPVGAGLRSGGATLRLRLLVDGLGELVRGLGQRLGLRGDLADVVALEHGAELLHPTLDQRSGLGIERLAVLLESVFSVV